jgi:uncharacterized protein
MLGQLPIGTLADRDDEAPAILDAARFNRHTFWCGQSGSGKTYALGVVLERLLLGTRLPILVLDPNADFVRLTDVRETADPEVAAALRRLDVTVLRPGTGPGERLHARLVGLPVVRARRCYGLTHCWTVRSTTSFCIWKTRSARRTPEAFWTCCAPLAIRSAGNSCCGSRTSASSAGSCGRGVDARRGPQLCPTEPVTPVEQVLTERVVQIAAEGRKYGLWLLLSTQRPTKIHPNALTQCDNLGLLRMSSPRDLDELAELFGYAPPDMLAASPHFTQGQVLFAGGFVPQPAMVRIGPRLTHEGGSDVRVPL